MLFFMCLSKCSDNKRKLIYSISTKDESKSGKVFDAGDSIVWDVDIIGDTLWIATIPSYSWEEMKTQQRR